MKPIRLLIHLFSFIFLLSAVAISFPVRSQIKKATTAKTAAILPAAEQPGQYLPLLKGKTIALFANQTSMAGKQHLVDVLQQNGIQIKVIFGPEHGFRGDADAGEHVSSGVDKATGIPVVSLYGAKRMPSADDLKDVDIMLFDIQDAGVRFYTFISSLQDYMEAALINNIPLMILDRPNPNGFYVDGPVLNPRYKSFVGMQPVPVVYGMTIGEYAGMILQEGWLSKEANTAYERLKTVRYRGDAKFFQLRVIPCANYTHKSKYVLPVRPSPNLPDAASIYWYPSTCFFEGTVISEGRGTDHPFAIFGHPSLPKSGYRFIPTSREGAKEPKLKGQICYGWNVNGTDQEVLKKINNRLQLSYLLKAYQMFPVKDSFFIKPKSGAAEDYFFNKLAGNAVLMQQIRSGKTETQIRQSWAPELTAFKKIRKKYLLYADFE